MSAPMEVVVCSDSAGQLWNCAVFELHSGTNLLSYRGGNTSARSLAILNGEHLLGAQLGKNYINVWEIQRKDQLQQKIVCPGIVTCLTGSPNGLYLLAGIAESIYLWEVSTGSLLAVLNRHYQDLTCLRFTDDSSHFISGGKDNLALVWSICSVLQADPSQTPEPRHVWARHSLPITDIHCGLMGPQARVATASLDQTVKPAVDLGDLLCHHTDNSSFMFTAVADKDQLQQKIVCPGIVTCLTGSPNGLYLLAGIAESIYLWEVSTGSLLAVLNRHYQDLTCLRFTDDSSHFISGGKDNLALVWSICRSLLLTSTGSRCRWRTIQDVGAHGGSGLLGLGWPALELRGFRASFRDQPALIPGREHLGSVPGYPERGTPSRSPARQELHQRVGDPEKGTAAVKEHNTGRAQQAGEERKDETN
ncbi:WD repeat-containing protein 18 [Acipenser ruthenus]|uniref:WD repeat-containing protein 18 n=1 Tax=Acipenser ruthenus TaxID=7906 RepID=A0A444V554_ACIRT|nr:WD repeat-containing protein 18 [Acipenser ruthenus]